jgi:tetratricopeptide (TPR) repeat protein
MRTPLLRALPFAAAIALYAALRIAAVGWSRHAPPFVDNPLAGTDGVTRAVNSVLLFGRYVGKMLWPRSLSVEYGFDQIPVVAVVPWGGFAAAAIAAALIAAIVLLYRGGRREAAFLVAFVPAAFVVTANLFFPIGTIFAERLAYTPLMGFCGLAGLALTVIPRRAFRNAAVAVLLVALAGRSFVRCADYASLPALSEATAAASPRSVKALYNAGRTRLREGDATGASALLQRAVEIRPEYAAAWRTLAEAYTALGDPARAAEATSRAAAATRVAPADEPL